MAHRRVKNIQFSMDDYLDDDSKYDYSYYSGDDDDDYGDYTFGKRKECALAKAKPKVRPTAKPAEHLSIHSGVSSRIAKKDVAELRRLLQESLKEEEDTSSSDRALNLVVIGHVDAGKSTLLGHLFLQIGMVSVRDVERFKHEAKEIGKGSFALAWVFDEGSDEREAGITVDVTVKHFRTESRIVTVLDAPGHKDFVPNMICAAMQAEVGLLVVDVSDFAAGFSGGGQTKEHLQLARALGIQDLIVGVNKLDKCGYSQEVFDDIRGQLLAYLTTKGGGFDEKRIHFVPLSAFDGVNIGHRPLDKSHPLRLWWNDCCLYETIDRIPVAAKSESLNPNPMIACVVDSWNAGGKPRVTLRIDAGVLRRNDASIPLVLKPGEDVVSFMGSLKHNGEDKLSCAAGMYVDEVTVKQDDITIAAGSIIADVDAKIYTLDTFVALVKVFDTEVPIVPGQQVMLYIHALAIPATISEIVEKNAQEGAKKNKISNLSSGSMHTAGSAT